MQKEVTEADIAHERTEQQFFNTLLELNYVGKNISLNSIINKASSLAKTLPNYSDWPHNAEQFWNAEAVCWKGRVEKEVRDKIKQELSFLDGKNLDLGSGSFSYVEKSVVVDFSEEMLLLNDAARKVVANLEKSLPLADELFDSVTMVFVASYIENLGQLLSEAKRVLKSGGTLIIVQSAEPVIELHKMHYKNDYGEAELRIFLNNLGFNVKSYAKDVHRSDILFLIGEKVI